MTSDCRYVTGREIRALCRTGDFQGPTTGVALGYAQMNLVVVQSGDAKAFEQFCRENARPCPLLEVTEPGNPETQWLAAGADVRTDLPRYRVFRHGQCMDRTHTIEMYWTKESVAFLIGCSFTFESALLKAGLPVRHIEEGRNVPMYRTNRECRPVGPFHGPLVVSMRPMRHEQAELAARITSEYPRVHGSPVHMGDPAALGILDLSKPDFGDAVTIHEDEIPVFWACGVTPMAALAHAKLELTMTHEPGHMFVSDLSDEALRGA